MTPKLRSIEEPGERLDAIRARARKAPGDGAAETVRYVGFFEVVETRPLT